MPKTEIIDISGKHKVLKLWKIQRKVSNQAQEIDIQQKPKQKTLNHDKE